MAQNARRIILKPTTEPTERLRTLREGLQEAVRFQHELARGSHHVLELTSDLLEDERSFFVEHEPCEALVATVLFDPAAPKADAQTLLNATAALADALRAVHACSKPRQAVHGGICPGTVLVTPDGITKLSDFGFAVAICRALGVEAYIELAVGCTASPPHARIATGVWEVLAANDGTRDDRLCSFIDPYKYGTAHLDTFEPASDVIALGILLHLLAEHRHPRLGGAEDHRLVATAESMAFWPYTGSRRKDLRDSREPAVQKWCELVGRMLSDLPRDRPSADEVLAALGERGVRPSDRSSLARSRLEQVNAATERGAWQDVGGIVEGLDGNASIPEDLRDQLDRQRPPPPEDEQTARPDEAKRRQFREKLNVVRSESPTTLEQLATVQATLQMIAGSSQADPELREDARGLERRIVGSFLETQLAHVVELITRSDLAEVERILANLEGLPDLPTTYSEAILPLRKRLETEYGKQMRGRLDTLAHVIEDIVDSQALADARLELEAVLAHPCTSANDLDLARRMRDDLDGIEQRLREGVVRFFRITRSPILQDPALVRNILDEWHNSMTGRAAERSGLLVPTRVDYGEEGITLRYDWKAPRTLSDVIGDVERGEIRPGADSLWTWLAEFCRILAPLDPDVAAIDALHGTLHPAGIQSDPTHHLYVMDAGLAPVLLRLPGAEPQVVWETLGPYVAPELLTNDPPWSFSTDVFAVGRLLFALATGRLPEITCDDQSGRSGQSGSSPPSLASLRPDLPQSLVDFVQAMLAPDPKQRPLSLLHVWTEAAKLAPQVVPTPPPVGPSKREQSLQWLETLERFVASEQWETFQQLRAEGVPVAHLPLDARGRLDIVDQQFAASQRETEDATMLVRNFIEKQVLEPLRPLLAREHVELGVDLHRWRREGADRHAAVGVRLHCRQLLPKPIVEQSVVRRVMDRFEILELERLQRSISEALHSRLRVMQQTKIERLLDPLRQGLFPDARMATVLEPLVSKLDVRVICASKGSTTSEINLSLTWRSDSLDWVETNVGSLREACVATALIELEKELKDEVFRTADLLSVHRDLLRFDWEPVVFDGEFPRRLHRNAVLDVTIPDTQETRRLERLPGQFPYQASDERSRRIHAAEGSLEQIVHKRKEMSFENIHKNLIHAAVPGQVRSPWKGFGIPGNDLAFALSAPEVNAELKIAWEPKRLAYVEESEWHQKLKRFRAEAGYALEPGAEESFLPELSPPRPYQWFQRLRGWLSKAPSWAPPVAIGFVVLFGAALSWLAFRKCDDGNECTANEKRFLSCRYPPLSIDSPCGDSTESACDHPDSCDGKGRCEPRWKGPGERCTDDMNRCTLDVCDGKGSCRHEPLRDGEPCSLVDDGSTTGVCHAGQCEPALIDSRIAHCNRLTDSMKNLEEQLGEGAHEKASEIREGLETLGKELQSIDTDRDPTLPSVCSDAIQVWGSKLEPYRGALDTYGDNIKPVETSVEDVLDRLSKAKKAWPTVYVKDRETEWKSIEQAFAFAQKWVDAHDWTGVRFFVKQARSVELSAEWDKARGRIVDRTVLDYKQKRRTRIRESLPVAWGLPPNRECSNLMARLDKVQEARELLEKIGGDAEDLESDFLDENEKSDIERLNQWTMCELRVQPKTDQSAAAVPITFVFIREKDSGLDSMAAFWISQTEVTVAQYYAVVGTIPREDDPEMTPNKNYLNNKYPVGYINVKRATEFVEKLRELSPTTLFNLPTHRQWEYANFAGAREIFDAYPSLRTYNGKTGEPETNKIAKFANLESLELGQKRPEDFSILEKTWKDDFAEFAPVEKYPPNRWGLYDMYGNVQEWVRLDDSKREKYETRGGSFDTYRWFLDATTSQVGDQNSVRESPDESKEAQHNGLRIAFAIN